MKELIMTYGLPGSGKDYWAKQLMRKYPGKYKRINKDDLREMLDLSEFSFENEKIVLDVRDSLVTKFLSRGYSVIVSDTNFPFEGKHFKRMCEIAQSIGDVQVIQKFIDTPLKKCKEQNLNRLRVVPEHIIDNMYNKHIVNKSCDFHSVYFEPINQKWFTEEAYMNEFDREDAILVDIDGTLAKMNGRGAFEFDKVLDDELNRYLEGLLHSIKIGYTGIKLLVVSGRDDSCLSDTKLWLRSNGINFDGIYMRKTGDKRKDSIIKEEIYDNEIKDKYNVLFVFDDRNQVVEMWRRKGLFTLQVNDGDF